MHFPHGNWRQNQFLYSLAWEVMQESVHNGIEAEGVLPGGLGLRRKASDYLIRAKGYGNTMRNRGMVYAYALAVSEENACGGKIVTAPTCGSWFFLND